jgi:hypothetical protein
MQHLHLADTLGTMLLFILPFSYRVPNLSYLRDKIMYFLHKSVIYYSMHINTVSLEIIEIYTEF